MELIEDIIKSETRYTKLTSTSNEQKTHITFIDNITPDLPTQNYTFITKYAPIETIRSIIEEKREKLKSKKAPYARLVFDPQLPFSAELPELADFIYNRYNIFTINIDETSTIYADSNCSVTHVTDRDKLIKLYENFNSYSTDNDPHIERWLDIKLKESELETIVYKKDGELIGSCELFFHENLVKLDEFEVLKGYREQGVGHALLKSAISVAKSRGSKTLYLIAENREWLTNYYLKKGFNYYSVYNSCTLYG